MKKLKRLACMMGVVRGPPFRTMLMRCCHEFEKRGRGHCEYLRMLYGRWLISLNYVSMLILRKGGLFVTSFLFLSMQERRNIHP